MSKVKLAGNEWEVIANDATSLTLRRRTTKKRLSGDWITMVIRKGEE